MHKTYLALPTRKINELIREPIGVEDMEVIKLSKRRCTGQMNEKNRQQVEMGIEDIINRQSICEIGG